MAVTTAAVVATAASAYGAYNQSKAQKAAARAAGQPQQSSQQQDPWAPTQPYLQDILAESQRLYQQPHQLPKYKGGGGASQTTRDLLGRLTAGPQLPERSSAGAIDRYATDQLGGDTNPYRQSLAAALGGLGGERADNRALVERLLASGQAFAPDSPAGAAGVRGSAPVYQYVSGGGYQGGGGSGAYPDAAAGSGTFARETRKMFERADNWEADPALRQQLDLMQSEAEEDFSSNRALLEARIEAGGRFGSGAHRAGLAAVTDEISEALAQARASTLTADRQAALNRAMEALGVLRAANADILASDTSRSNAATAAGASRANTEAALGLERELGLRGQDIQALSLLFGSEAGGMDTMARLSEGLDASRATAGQLGLGLGELDLGRGNLDLSYLERAAGVSGGIDARRAASADRRYQAELDQYREQGRQLDDYWRRVLGVAGTGSSSAGTQPGQYVSPGPNPWAAGIRTGLGTASELAGLWQNLGGGPAAAAGLAPMVPPYTGGGIPIANLPTGSYTSGITRI